MDNPQPWWLTMPPAELAARILALLSSHGTAPERQVMKAITSWFSTGSYSLPRDWPGRPPFDQPDIWAVAEAIQVLEHANLLVRAQGLESLLYVRLTRLGWHALQTNTVRQHLGLADAPPTA
ncbi:hypothetical protein [Mycolicibacterium moriokaense]|uniref:Uncharacterized protein n=1 Tax=Mycolicibacterium moriokaense TaxID=39691 RepID=A0A318HGH2_9MYCO|nr:hypothetical protein [Mycolicibacterium moriokaense]PXX06357.1 hypothetical protein C8E89_114130 [Mycolicibacterium moriokaense]